MENGIDSFLRNITMLLAIMLILIAIKKNWTNKLSIIAMINDCAPEILL